MLMKQLLIAICLNIGHIITGYGVGWSAPVIPKLQDPDQTPLPDVISVTTASWVGSSFNIGIIFGPYIAGYVSNKFGRKVAIMLGGAVTMVGNLLLALAVKLSMIYAGRAIIGFGMGMIVVTNIVYIGEIASPNIRGIILTSTGVFHCFGILIAYAVGPFVPYPVIGYVTLCLGALHLFACMFIPESPIFYLIKGREDKTVATFNLLGRGKDTDELQTTIENFKKQEQQFKWHELVTVKANRKSFMIAMPAFFFQQWCGLLAVLFFTTTIFQKAGSSIKPDIATIITGATQFLGTLVVPTIIEKLGRKTLMLMSCTGCGVTMAIMGVYFYMDLIKHPIVPTIGWVPLAALVIAIVSFSFGLNIVPNTLCGELFCPNVRSIGSSIILTVSCAMGFVSVTSFGYLVEAMGIHYVFLIFTIVNVIAFFYTIIVIPETRGMTLTEIENMLSK